MRKKEFELKKLYALTCDDDGRFPQDRDKAEEKYNKEHPALYPKILNTIYYTVGYKEINDYTANDALNFILRQANAEFISYRDFFVNINNVGSVRTFSPDKVGVIRTFPCGEFRETIDTSDIGVATDGLIKSNYFVFYGCRLRKEDLKT